ncbi:prolyl oligopeptidase family serine peptidase [Flavobacterium mesophilum]|uniref:prolyl oligopeptidase family serine peptidase n=1 Tax=Flavobacterium mesophilum TaxID=3143495 RepID=UPI0031D9D7BB
MIRKTTFTLLVFITSQISQAQYKYPSTPERPVTNDYFGTKITDSYQWIEDMKNPEVQKWFKDQANYTDSFIQKIPGRDAFLKRAKEIQNYSGDIYGYVRQFGNNYYYSKTKKGEKKDKLCYREGLDGNDVVLFDPETIKHGTNFVDFVVSPDQKKIAISLSEGGSEICDLKILDIATKTFLPDNLGPVWSEFNFEFTPDSKAVIYTKMSTSDNNSDELLKNMKSLLHVIGTDPATDKILASKANNPDLNLLEEQFPHFYFSDDNSYLVLSIGSTKSTYLTFYAPFAELNKEKINWKPLIKYDDEITNFDIINNKLFFISHKNAPNSKLGFMDMKNPDFDKATIVVPETDKVLRRMQKTKDFIFYSLSDGINQDKYQINAKTLEIKKIPLPKGTNGGYPFSPRENNEMILANSGWITPATRYFYNGSTGRLEKGKHFTSSKDHPDYLQKYTVKEVEVASHDGVMVPLSIIYPKNMKMDASTPCYIYGYGAYGSSEIPIFIGPALMALLEQNTVIAYAHVRGGGEKGAQWHKNGMKANKPNTWKDFIACTEYLIKEKYTSSDKLIGHGISMGGVLIGRALTSRPDLFKVGLVEVGDTNIVRSEISPNGMNQIPEIGSIKNEEEAKSILEMDSQSKVKKGEKYPAVYIHTGINDSRVDAWMPGKFAAILQNYNSSNNPTLLHVNYSSGHFASDSNSQLENDTDMFSFALWQVGNPNFQIKQ